METKGNMASVGTGVGVIECERRRGGVESSITVYG